MENIFIDNKYTKWYFKIITNAQPRLLPKGTYSEIHHVIPKSFFTKSKTKNSWLPGDPNDNLNLVTLTGHEHFVCHLLLIKMVNGNAYHKVISALNGMRRAKKGQERYIASGRIYAIIRKKFAEEHSKFLSGKPTGRTDNGLTGHKQSSKTIEKRVKKLRGLKRTEEQKENIKAGQRKAYASQTEEEKQEYSKAMSRAKKGKSIGTPSQAHRESLSKSLRGKTKGIGKSEETRQNMRKPKSESHKKNMSKPKIRVSRIQDKREMAVNQFTKWLKTL